MIGMLVVTAIGAEYLVRKYHGEGPSFMFFLLVVAVLCATAVIVRDTYPVVCRLFMSLLSCIVLSIYLSISIHYIIPFIM